MVRIENLYKNFGKLEVLKGLNLEIQKGGVFAVLGPNGSGKTTLIKSILGLTIPNKGSIYVDDLLVKNQWAYRNDINYLPQIANFPGNLSVNELIRMIKDLRNKPTNEQELIELFDLGAHLKKKLSNLSGGTRQKVNIVLCFMFDSPIIILDEPTTGLDPIAMIQLKELIQKAKDRGKLILITSHIMSFVEHVSDEIVFILEGKIYFKGTVDNLKTQMKKATLEESIAALIKN